MKTSLFDFELPDALIAAAPASPRDSARMLVVGEHVADDFIASLPMFLKPGDVMVFNDTRVIPARLMGRRGEAKIEILLHKQLARHPANRETVAQDLTSAKDSALARRAPQNDESIWHCFAKPAKRLKQHDRIDFAPDFYATVADKLPDGQVALAFNVQDTALKEMLVRYGAMPLPPYIEKKRHADATDTNNYQTVYAKHDGSVAAPTAGLHFTDRLLAAIDAVGVKRVHVTLHVGGGTFLPVKVDDTDDHVMHSEYAVVTKDVADAITHAKKNGGRVIAVGTTSLRTLESACDDNGMMQPMARDTDIFITPGYQFKCVDVLLTNFHLPRSTLFMLVSAFSGLECMQAAYAHAISQQYRFYSYGDACLLFKGM